MEEGGAVHTPAGNLHLLPGRLRVEGHRTESLQCLRGQLAVHGHLAQSLQGLGAVGLRHDGHLVAVRHQAQPHRSEPLLDLGEALPHRGDGQAGRIGEVSEKHRAARHHARSEPRQEFVTDVRRRSRAGEQCG